MERTISVEEKIRRAEELYERRKQGTSRPVATVNVSDKKDITLFKKMIIQIIICIAIYLIFYVITNNKYPFSEDFTIKAKELLSYDTNFAEIYQNIKNSIESWTNNNNNNSIDNNNNNSEQQEITPPEESIGGSDETTTQENKKQNNTENFALAVEDNKMEENKNLTQEEQDIINVKNTTTFIKPIEGTISSRFGHRENATGRVPKNHTGTDIAANLGTKIKASTEGEVVLASEEGDYGKHLKIQVGDVSIIYAHCNNLYVKQGDKIAQGQEIAEVGSTGNSTRSPFTF